MTDTPRSPHEALFEGYWAKMLRRYAGITPEEFDAIMRQRREEKTGKQRK